MMKNSSKQIEWYGQILKLTMMRSRRTRMWIQHNVLTWEKRKFDLTNTYIQYDPDVILINSHGLKDSDKLKIPGYCVHQSNSTGEAMDGVAIAERRNLSY